MGHGTGSERPSTPTHSRRDVLRLGAFLAANALASPFLVGCGAPGDPSRSTGGASQRTITVLAGAGDPLAEPPLRRAYDDFAAAHPGITWDVRALPGGGPEWDRLARSALAAGEPVALTMINGQQTRAWVRDGLLADLGADPAMTTVLERVPAQFHFGDPTLGTVNAFPLAITRGVHTTGLFVNRALLDRAGVPVPSTVRDLAAMVEPLAALGAAPLVHCSGDVFFNQILITWLLPMIAEREGDPVAFAERCVRGEARYDGPAWLEAFQTILNLRTSGVLLPGSVATDYGTMQQLVLQGKAAMTFNGTWLLPLLQAGSPGIEMDLHVAPPPLVDGASRPRPILAWTGFGLPAAATDRDDVYAFLEYASRPDVDQAIVEGLQAFSPLAGSNDAIADPIAQEFLPMFDDAILPLDWLWEPDITAVIDEQVQALVGARTDARSAAAAVQAVADELRRSGRGYGG